MSNQITFLWALERKETWYGVGDFKIHGDLTKQNEEFLPHNPEGLSWYCFHAWCPDGHSGGQAVGNSLSGLYLRNCKV